MGELFGATYSIIKKPVGRGFQTQGREVKRINQLLRLAGYLTAKPVAEDQWTDASNDALVAFQEALCAAPVQRYIEPKDPFDKLFSLALIAKVLIPLPYGLRSASAVTVLYNHCRSANYPYGWHADGTRVIWGFEGRPAWAIATTLDRDFSSPLTITLNCTSFANLMLSVWVQGNVHAPPYDASQMVGGWDLLALRYGLQPVNDNKLVFDGFCFSADGLQDLEKDRLYSVSFTRADGFGKHDVVLLNGEFYEANDPGDPKAVFKTPPGATV